MSLPALLDTARRLLLSPLVLESPLVLDIEFLGTKDRSNASNSNGTIVNYRWDFGDGNITAVSEPLINHTYNSFGNYTVTLNITNNQDQWNTTTKIITITFLTDINRDRTVNIQDVTIVAVAYGSKPGDTKWNPIADLDKNNIVNIIDISMVAKDFNKSI